MSTLKSDSIQPTNTGNNLIFKTGVGDAERMRINTSGNVGIGTASPTSPLDVNGTIKCVHTTNTLKASIGHDGRNILNFIQGGGDYMGIGYNLLHTGTNDTWNYAGVDRASLLRWNYGGFQFWGTSTTGAANAPASLLNLMTITGSGNVGIGTATPGASLDVNGTLKVGDFGGATNVMVKPARVSGGGVGHVVPLFTWSSAFGAHHQLMNHTTPLHGGTWLVYFAGHTDSNNESENFSCVMNHVWTVPASKWLTFATSTTFTSAPSATSNTDSRVWYKIHDDLLNLRTTTTIPADITAGNGWSPLNSSNAYTLSTQDATDTSKIGFVYNNSWFGPVVLIGYAIRIA